MLNCTNWVINGLSERFPKLPVIWIESGLAWIPFLMQRLDHEYMLRPSEAPLLKKKPSDYMREMYYSSQPMEIQDHDAMQTTFRMINATCHRPSGICRSCRKRASTTSSAARLRGCSSSRRATKSRKRI